MTYVIYKDEKEVNRIVADEEFCAEHYSGSGYSYGPEPPPEILVDPVGETPTEAEDVAAMLIDHEYRLTLMELGLSEGDDV